MASGMRGVAGSAADGYVASGSNVLRGGKRVFQSRTLDGGWYEDREAPGFSGVRPEARTEEQARQAAVTGRVIPKYGAAILDAEERAARAVRYDPKNTVAPDTYARPADWRSTAAASFRPSGVGPDADLVATSSTFHPKHHEMVADAARAADYRARWLNHDGGGHQLRFRTVAEDSLASAVHPRFRAQTTRTLPGVPKSVESLRSVLLAGKGLMALVLLRRAFAAMDDSGDGALSREELQVGLADLGAKLSVDEFNELFRFLDADKSGGVSWPELVAVLTGRLRTPAGAGARSSGPSLAASTVARAAPVLSTTRAAVVAAAWEAIAARGDVAAATGSVPVRWLRAQADLHSFPDVKMGSMDPDSLATLLFESTTPEPGAPSGAGESGVDAAAFELLHRAWSPMVGLDDEFAGILAALWRVSVPGAGAAAGPASGASVCKVLVTHARTGRKTVEDVPMGPFFDRSDKADIVRRLRSMGIEAATVSLDF